MSTPSVLWAPDMAQRCPKMPQCQRQALVGQSKGSSVASLQGEFLKTLIIPPVKGNLKCLKDMTCAGEEWDIKAPWLSHLP